MSRRTGVGRRIELLPTFAPPPGVRDFAIENRPATLSGNPSRPCLLCVGVVLCVIGIYSTVSVAAGPVLEHGSSLARGVSSAVGKAISNANREAERNVKLHYEARERYFSRRRASSDQATSSLLLKLAAVVDNGRLDDDAVEQFFPEWVTERRLSWNEDAVLRDLVVAVSQISHTLSVDESKS